MPPFLSFLGLTGQLMTAAVIVLIAIYLYRAQKMGRMFASMAGATAFYMLVILVAAAVATGLGWINPRPSLMIDHVRSGGSFLINRVKSPVVSLIEFLVGKLF